MAANQLADTADQIAQSGQQTRRLLPRLGITAKVYLWGIGILLLAFAITAGASWYIAGEQARANIESAIDGGLGSFQADYAQDTGDLETLSKWLAGQPTFLRLVQEGDKQGLTEYLKPWTAASIVDALTVTDSRGVVLTRVRTDQTTAAGDDISNSLGIEPALKGQASSGLDQDPFGRFQGRFLFPIYSDPQSAPVGVLIAGFFLDGDFIKHLSNEGIMQVVVAYQDRIVASTLKDQQGKPWVGWLTPVEVIAAERQNEATGPVVLQTPAGQYLFKFRPLLSPSGQTIGMYGVGQSLAALEEQRAALFKAFGLGLVAALAALVLAALLFARVFLSPIRTLDAAADSIAQGDLTTAITLRSRDELGDLGRRMNAMRQELQKALQAVDQEKSWYESILGSMGMAAVVTDGNRRIILANPAAERLLQQSEPSISGCAWEEVLIPAPESARPVPALHELGPASPTGQPIPTTRSRFRLKAQPRVLLEVVSAPLRAEAGQAGSVHLIEDISAQEQLIRSKDEFAMNVAHELRGPTASLRTFVDLLREDYRTMNTGDLKLLVDAMQRSIVKFQRTVENLIDIGSIQAGQFHVDPIPNEVDDILREAAGQAESLVKTNGQTLQVNTEGSNLMVLADEARIVQVLANLLTNASKYSPEGEWIKLSVKDQGDCARFEVVDHGRGIPVEAQAHLFDRFYRVRRAREEPMGIGLGLALAKAIIEAHGGQIGVESFAGQGSTFWFTLPLVR